MRNCNRKASPKFRNNPFSGRRIITEAAECNDFQLNKIKFSSTSRQNEIENKTQSDKERKQRQHYLKIPLATSSKNNKSIKNAGIIPPTVSAPKPNQGFYFTASNIDKGTDINTNNDSNTCPSTSNHANLDKDCVDNINEIRSSRINTNIETHQIDNVESEDRPRYRPRSGCKSDDEQSLFVNGSEHTTNGSIPECKKMQETRPKPTFQVSGFIPGYGEIRMCDWCVEETSRVNEDRPKINSNDWDQPVCGLSNENSKNPFLNHNIPAPESDADFYSCL